MIQGGPNTSIGNCDMPDGRRLPATEPEPQTYVEVSGSGTESAA
jgi:hypothetical protein